MSGENQTLPSLLHRPVQRRYGWIPDALPDDLLERAPWLAEHLHGKTSVTELEMLHGALNNPDMAGRAFFYFRDPAYAKTRGADFQSESADSALKETVLKMLIKQICAAKKIPLHDNYPAPSQDRRARP